MKKTRNNSKKTGVILVTLLVVLAGAVAALEITDTTYWFHDKPAKHTASEYTKGETQNTDTHPGKIENIESMTLIEPTGNFVSTHKAKPTTREASTCNSTPGAKCTIVFTKGSLTKSLPTQVVDEGGAAYWDWKPKGIGLTAGSWQIKAVVTLGSQELSAEDALTLTVSK